MTFPGAIWAMTPKVRRTGQDKTSVPHLFPNPSRISQMAERSAMGQMGQVNLTFSVS